MRPSIREQLFGFQPSNVVNALRGSFWALAAWLAVTKLAGDSPLGILILLMFPIGLAAMGWAALLPARWIILAVRKTLTLRTVILDAAPGAAIVAALALG